MIFAVITLTFLSSYMLSAMDACLLSGGVLMLLSVYLYFWYHKRSNGLLLCPAGLFSLSWIGGAGISALRLSWLQSAWETETWVVIWGFSVSFLFMYECFSNKRYGSCEKSPVIKPCRGKREDCSEKEALLTALVIFITTGISVSAFIFEAVKLGYVPLFTVDMPHAYSYFHVTGVHYFTTAFVLVPAEAAVYFREIYEIRMQEAPVPDEGGLSRFRAFISGPKGSVSPAGLLVLLCVFLSLLLPILLVSRFQLILAVGLCVFTILILRGPDIRGVLTKKRVLELLGLLIACIGAYVFLTIERAHSIAYLRSIFEMKDDSLPIWIIQPYMYVANNFDNLNCLVRDLAEHTGGLRMLYPVFVFTGLKFFHPELVSFPLYVTKEELTTLTVAYDAYYDFGLLGVLAFGAVLGACMGLLECRLLREPGSGLLSMIGAQLIFYLCLSFFTTWYSNPSTWFYLAASLASCIFIKIGLRIIYGRKKE